jgi:acyl-CoA thioesterase FadM
MEQEIWRGDTRLIVAKVTLACVGAGGRPARMPADLVATLRRLAGV